MNRRVRNVIPRTALAVIACALIFAGIKSQSTASRLRDDATGAGSSTIQVPSAHRLYDNGADILSLFGVIPLLSGSACAVAALAPPGWLRSAFRPDSPVGGGFLQQH